MDTTKPTRAMGLDVGDVRIGIAVSDPLRIISQPYGVIERKNRYHIRIIEQVIAHNIADIIVGLPLTLNGKMEEQAIKTISFCRKLERLLDETFAGRTEIAATQELTTLTRPKIRLIDERYTTAQAERTIQGERFKNKERKEAVDKISASLILENFLQGQKSIGLDEVDCGIATKPMN